MHKDALEKIHPKFKNERQCKNERCAGYFLSEEPQDYCPACRRKGLDKKEENKDLVYKETNTQELEKKVAALEKRIARMTDPKEKTFKSKKCANCETEFTPAAPNQQMCDSCRDILIS